MKISLIDMGVFIDKPKLLDPLKAVGEVEVHTGLPETIEEVIARGESAEVIAFGLMQFTNEMLDKLPKLKVLQFVGTGVWNFVDVNYAESKGIKVLNIDGYGSNAVAEFAVGAAFTLARKLCLGDKVIKEGKWTIDNLDGSEIAGSTVGVIGTGNIGRMAAEKFINLGAKVVACDIYENEYLKSTYGVEYTTMEEVFKLADIISLHMKVTPENEKIVDKKLLSLMKKSALLINVARAELVDNEALYEALKAGTIGGAAIDVFNSEPPSEADYRLGSLQNVIATPHIGYYTQEANDNSIKMMVESILES